MKTLFNSTWKLCECGSPARIRTGVPGVPLNPLDPEPGILNPLSDQVWPLDYRASFMSWIRVALSFSQTILVGVKTRISVFKHLLIFLTTFTAGFLGSMLGVGGGFLIVPILVLLLKIPMHQAVALSLVAISGTAVSSLTIYISRSLVNFRIGVILESVTILGAAIGPNIALKLEAEVLEFIFGSVLLYVTYRMWARREAGESDGIVIGPSCIRWTTSLLGAFSAGLIASMIGIGGGTLKVPIMYLILGVPMRIAVATSQFMISLTSVISSSIYILNGLVNLDTGVAAIIGSIGGAQLGSRVGLKLRVHQIRRLFSIILAFFSVTMILKSVHLIP